VRNLILKVIVLYQLCCGPRLGLGLGLSAGQVLAQTGSPAGPSSSDRGISYLGAFLGDVSEDRARELKLPDVRGAVVGRIVEDSPAAKAGLKEGDVIVTCRGQKVEGREHFYGLLNAIPPGHIVTLGVSRDGTPQNIHVALSERRGPGMDERRRLFSEADSMHELGERLAQEAEAARQKNDEKQARDLSEQSVEMLKQAEERRAYVEKELREGRVADPSRPKPRHTTERQSSSSGHTRHPAQRAALRFLQCNNRRRHAGNGSEAGRVGGTSRNKSRGLHHCIQRRASRILADLTRLVGRTGKEVTEVVFAVVRDRREMTMKAKLSAQ
jgi:hypothetical protein